MSMLSSYLSIRQKPATSTSEHTKQSENTLKVYSKKASIGGVCTKTASLSGASLAFRE